MIMYVDETENDELFIVAGLLVDSEEKVEKAYHSFKNRIKGFRLGVKAKSDLYTEFKAFLLDKKYQRIKIRMLVSIKALDAQIIFSCYNKKCPIMKQAYKEKIYISLLTNIISYIDGETLVIFDRFGKADFERKIIDSVKTNSYIINIVPKNSQDEPGLQFADNVCSTLRLYKTGKDTENYYNYLKETVIEL